MQRSVQSNNVKTINSFQLWPSYDKLLDSEEMQDKISNENSHDTRNVLLSLAKRNIENKLKWN